MRRFPLPRRPGCARLPSTLGSAPKASTLLTRHGAKVPGRRARPRSQGARSSHSNEAIHLTFFAWLGRQTVRQDAVGVFARYAVKDRLFPRDARKLVLFLLRYEGMPEQRAGVKMAHREWRKTRKATA